MDNFSIFDEVKTERKFAKFVNVGDAYEGTYISRVDNVQNMYGQMQTLVDLKQKDGTIITVAIRDSKKILLEQLDQTDYGQIIGFKFTHTKEQVGRNDSKIVKLVQDKRYVDKAWLEEYKQKQASLARDFGTGEIPLDQLETLDPGEAFTTPPAAIEENAPAAPIDPNKLKIITEMASAKFNVTNLEELKDKIMSETGLAVTPLNFDLIIERLK